MEDAEVQGRIKVAGEVTEEVAVEVDVGFARAGEVEGCAIGEDGDVKVRAEEVGIGAQRRIVLRPSPPMRNSSNRSRSRPSLTC